MDDFYGDFNSAQEEKTNKRQEHYDSIKDTFKYHGFTLPYTDEDYKEGLRFVEIAKNFHGSITKGKGALEGRIAELVINRWLKNPKKVADNYNFDIYYNGLRIESKAKRVNQTHGKIPYHYLCNVSARNSTQKCDYYIFSRVSLQRPVVWILGILSREDFHKKKHFLY